VLSNPHVPLFCCCLICYSAALLLLPCCVLLYVLQQRPQQLTATLLQELQDLCPHAATSCECNCAERALGCSDPTRLLQAYCIQHKVVHLNSVCPVGSSSSSSSSAAAAAAAAALPGRLLLLLLHLLLAQHYKPEAVGL
jgi:hypothetical protein